MSLPWRVWLVAWLLAPLGFGAAGLVPNAAWAAPKKKAPDGLSLAKDGDCVGAVPLLEQAESKEHKPETAAALARCHVALGELLFAHDIYEALAAEQPQRSWSRADKKAHAEAKTEADLLSARLPQVTLEVEPAELELRVSAAGRSVARPRAPFRVPPDERVQLSVEADGYAEYRTEFVLREGSDKTIGIVLELLKKPPPNRPVKPAGSGGPDVWLGAEFRGLLVPTFLMNIVAEGGTTTYLPGAFANVTARLGDVDLKTSLGVTSYGLGTTPFKPADAPDTEWELVESSLVGLTASLDVMYVIPLDPAEKVAFKVGAGFGLGVMISGDLLRWQSYPEDGEPGDPSSYKKCKAPNDPPGTFRYCNQLDKDVDRYGEPDQVWGDGGAQPVVYPWLSLPQLGFAFKPVRELAIDVEVGVTLHGFLTSTGVRYGF